MSGPPVLVCGYYGFGNAGDEAILAVLIQDLNREFDQPQITVVGGSVKAIAADHKVDAVHWRDLPSIRDAARDSDLMVLGGGGLFQDQQVFDPTTILTMDHGGMSYWSGFALLSHMVEKPLTIYAVGVGPLSSADGRRLTALTFNTAVAATVRDRESAALLAELGIHDVRVTADPVFMMSADRKIGLEILDDEQIAHDSQLIAVAIRPWASDAFVGELAAQLDTLVAAHQARIVFVPFQTSPHRLENDPAMALNVLTHMKHATSASIVRGTYTPEDKMAILAASELVIGMRLHAVIMAAVAGAPVVALAYDPKIINTMTAISADNMVLGLDDLGMLAQKATWAMSETSYRTTLLRGAQVLAEAAAQNAQVFKPAMDRPPRIADPLAIETSAFALRQFESRSAREQVQVASRQLKELTTRHNDLQTKWDELARSRSLRLVNTWWRFRNFLARRRPEETLAEGTRAEFEIALAELLDRHRDTPGMVVFPPTIGWSAHLFQRPHQMARAFARLGYLTFFGVDWGGRDGVSGFEYVEERLCLMALPTAHQSILQAIPAPLMISYVYNFEFRQHLSNPTTVFEHIDHLEVFAPSYPMEKLSAWYDLAIKAADVAAASARDLQEEMLPERPDTVLAPNGVNFEHFAGYRPGPPPSDLEPLLAKPIVGYYGAMAKWLDYELAEHAARSLPDFNFVFIGPNYDDSMKGQPVFDLTNVVWLGTKPYDDLPAYLYRFSVASIPFQVNDVTHRVSPLKLFEYMAGGKPVVTTAMRECQHYSPPVLIAKDGSDWVDRLVEAERLSHDPDFVAILQRTARANTWDERVGTLIDVAARARVR